VPNTSIIAFTYKGSRYTATVEETDTEYKISPHQQELIAQFGDKSTLYRNANAFSINRGSPDYDYLNAIAKGLLRASLLNG